jgi:hypothetical protein
MLRHHRNPHHFTLRDLLTLGDVPPPDRPPQVHLRAALASTIGAVLLWVGLILGACWLASLFLDTLYATMRHPW